MMDEVCGDCLWRLCADEWICTNTFSKRCGRKIEKNTEACDCYEKPMSLDEILGEEI